MTVSHPIHRVLATRFTELVGCPAARRADRHGLGVGRLADRGHVGRRRVRHPRRGDDGPRASSRSCARDLRDTDRCAVRRQFPRRPTRPRTSSSSRVIDAGVRLISFAGPPSQSVVDGVHDAGLLVMPTVGARAARREDAAISASTRSSLREPKAVGTPASVPTSVLLPEVVDAVGATSRCSLPAASTTAAGLAAALTCAPTASPWARGSCSPPRSRVPDGGQAALPRCLDGRHGRHDGDRRHAAAGDPHASSSRR